MSLSRAPGPGQASLQPRWAFRPSGKSSEKPLAGHKKQGNYHDQILKNTSLGLRSPGLEERGHWECEAVEGCRRSQKLEATGLSRGLEGCVGGSEVEVERKEGNSGWLPGFWCCFWDWGPKGEAALRGPGINRFSLKVLSLRHVWDLQDLILHDNK